MAVADALGIERFVPVGYSMGGPIAMLMWHRHPHRVDGLVLCATFGTIATSPRSRRRMAILGGVGRSLDVVPRRARQAGFERLLRRQTDGRELEQWVLDEIASCDPRLLLQAGGAIGRFDARPWLDRIDVPASVLIMERDTVVPPHRQETLFEAIDARAWRLDADHDVCVMRPDVFHPPLLEAVDHATKGVDLPR